MKKSEFWSRYKYLVFFILIFSVSGVSIFKYVLTPEKKLPVYSPSMVNAELVSEDIQYKKKYHKISNFEMTNQNNELVTEKNYDNTIYVADFFFTTCPTICPIMKTHLLRVYKKYHDDDNLRLVSISIDPDFDQPAVLKDFAKKLNVDTNFWTFLTGNQEYIFNLGEKNFLVTTQKDDKELGGYLHSGALILIDTNRQIRGIYDGTKEEEVNELIRDIKRVKSEE